MTVSDEESCGRYGDRPSDIPVAEWRVSAAMFVGGVALLWLVFVSTLISCFFFWVQVRCSKPEKNRKWRRKERKEWEEEEKDLTSRKMDKDIENEPGTRESPQVPEIVVNNLLR